MSLARINTVKQYWEEETNFTPITCVMSGNHFQARSTKLLFVDNLSVTDEEKQNKL